MALKTEFKQFKYGSITGWAARAQSLRLRVIAAARGELLRGTGPTARVSKDAAVELRPVHMVDVIILSHAHDIKSITGGMHSHVVRMIRVGGTKLLHQMKIRGGSGGCGAGHKSLGWTFNDLGTGSCC